MKIYYFNDTSEFQYVHVNDLFGQGKALSPASGDYFEFDLKENQVPFIKVWSYHVVLLTGIDNNITDTGIYI
jgi:hypothetical protein